MNETQLIAARAYEQLQAGSAVVLLSIVGFQGSAPRHSGSKMLVTAAGTTYGTIGGSAIEASAVGQASKKMDPQQPCLVSFDLTAKAAASLGMICGGTVDVLLDHIEPAPDVLEFTRRWNDAASQGGHYYLFTHLNDTQTQVLGHAIWLPESDGFFATSLVRDDLTKLEPELLKISTTSILPLGDERVVVERVRKIKTVYCFGAGHVAVPTASLASRVGFRVVVLDDRPDFASAARFPEADRIIVLDDFSHALDGLNIDKDSFIIIVTRGHQYDRTVLKSSLHAGAGYLGMISSKKKRQAIYEDLIASGFSKEQLERVHSPIGIDIGGETPEEIAVSIVAELIKVRSQET